MSLAFDNLDPNVNVAAGCVGVGAYLVCRICKFLFLPVASIANGECFCGVERFHGAFPFVFSETNIDYFTPKYSTRVPPSTEA